MVRFADIFAPVCRVRIWPARNFPWVRSSYFSMTGQERQAGIETVGPITFLWTMGAGGLILAQYVGIRDGPVGAILGSRFGRSGPHTDQRSGDRADLGLRSCRP